MKQKKISLKYGKISSKKAITTPAKLEIFAILWYNYASLSEDGH